jgi:DNA polymerase V
MINFIKAPKFGDELENLSINKEGQKYFAEFHGGIRAGFPSPAEDFLSDRVSLDERYLSKIGSTFVNRVRGLSMNI